MVELTLSLRVGVCVSAKYEPDSAQVAVLVSVGFSVSQLTSDCALAEQVLAEVSTLVMLFV